MDIFPMTRGKLMDNSGKIYLHKSNFEYIEFRDFVNFLHANRKISTCEIFFINIS